jgi:hypothetical protein
MSGVHAPEAKKLKPNSKSFCKDSQAYRFLLEQFALFVKDGKSGISPEETNNAVIGSYFDRTPEFEGYSKKQFIKVNFRTCANLFKLNNLKTGFRAKATDSRSYEDKKQVKYCCSACNCFILFYFILYISHFYFPPLH